MLRSKSDPAKLNAALASIKNNSWSLRKAAQVYGIPRSTLHDKIKGKSPVIAYAHTLLNQEEEDRLAAWLMEISKRGFGKTADEVMNVAKSILATRGSASVSENATPTYSWLKSFFKRHPELSSRSPMSLGKERALVTPMALTKWFHDFKDCIDAIDPTIMQDPKRIYNADETGFSFDVKSRKVIACKGSKHVYMVTANVKTQVTVLACISASGHYLSPMLIYPYKRIPSKNLLEHFPEAFLQVSDNGWITAHIFHSWLRDCFIPATAHVQKPLVLLVDGHTSHTSLIETSQLCHSNNIILYCLMPHASHLIQPLDQAFFGAVKPAWSDAVRRHASSTGEGVNLENFSTVLRPVWFGAATEVIAAQSFKTAGIFPYDPERVMASGKLAPCTSYRSVAATIPSSSGDTQAKQAASRDTCQPATILSPSGDTQAEKTASIVTCETAAAVESIPSTSRDAPETVASTASCDPTQFAITWEETLQLTPEDMCKAEADDPHIMEDTHVQTSSAYSSNDLPAANSSFPLLPPVSNSVATNTVTHHQASSSSSANWPTRSSSSSVPPMSSDQLKALREYSIMLYEEVTRNQFHTFFRRLIDPSTENTPCLCEEALFSKFRDLSSSLLKVCEVQQEPEVRANLTVDDILKLPDFTSSKGKGKRTVSKNTPTMPNLLSGEEFRNALKNKMADKEKAEREKLKRKAEREEKKKMREKMKEEQKEKREKEKEERKRKKIELEEERKRKREEAKRQKQTVKLFKTRQPQECRTEPNESLMQKEQLKLRQGNDDDDEMSQ